MKNILDIELYNKLLNEYGEEYLNELDLNLFAINYKYLLKEGFYFIDDILIKNLWIFQFNNDSLKEVINMLKNDYGDNYVDIICKDLSIFDKYIGED